MVFVVPSTSVVTVAKIKVPFATLAETITAKPTGAAYP